MAFNNAPNLNEDQIIMDGSGVGYVSIRHEIANAQQEYGLIKGVKAHVNFDDKSYATAVPIIQGKDTTMGITLLQVYNPNSEIDVFGSGIRFNFSEELRVDTQDTSYYKYTDELGNAHNFRDKYYYESSYIVLSDTDVSAMEYNVAQGCYIHNFVKVEYDGQTAGGWRFVSAKERERLGQWLTAVNNAPNALKATLGEDEGQEMGTPTYYLMKGNQIKVFNAAGYLIQVGSSTGQFVYIVRENGHKILRIFDHNGKVIAFTYNNNVLQKITDSRGREIRYTFSGGRIQSIGYYASATSATPYETLTYDHHIVDGVKQNKTTLESSDGESATLEYATQEGNTLTKITYQPQDKTLTFSYDTNKVTVSDGEGTEEEFGLAQYSSVAYINAYKQTVNGKITAYNTYTISRQNSLNVRETKYPKRSQLCKGTVPSDLPIVYTVKNDRRQLPVEETQENIEVSPTVSKDVQTTYLYDEMQRLVRRRTVETYSTGESYAYVEESHYNDTEETDDNGETYTVYGQLKKKVSYVEGEEQTTGYTFAFYTYDSQGRATETKTVKKICECSGDCTCKALEDSTTLLGFVQEQTYDENGNVVSSKNELGYSTTYTYAENTQLVATESRPATGLDAYYQLSYDYDERDRQKKVLSGTSYNTVAYAAENVSAMGVKNNEELLQFTYDEKNRISQVSFGGSIYERISYGEKEAYGEYTVDRVELMNANGEKFKILSDVNGTKEWYFYTPVPVETLLFTKEYDEYGQLVKTTSGEDEETYTYDATGKLTHYTGNGITETYTYDHKGQVDEVVYTGAVNRTETYEYTDDSQGVLKKITSGDVSCIKTHDEYGRVVAEEIEIGSRHYDMASIRYLSSNNKQTNLAVYFENTEAEYGYSYDTRGNVVGIEKDGTLIKKYTYNTQSQLIEEEDFTLGQKVGYTYSEQGDITQKQVSVRFASGGYTVPRFRNYTYSTDGKNLMTAYNGSVCLYDSLGNPTTYKGKTLVWEKGKRLTSYDGLSFEYDVQGRRTKKGNESFIYDSQGRLLKSSSGLEILYAKNEAIGFIFGDATYIYCKDLFGNITAILDGSGNVVVKYDYDAWGNHRVLDNTGAVITDTQHIGHKNPFRYRGYYYDTETGLYYLKSRYYDPETCRFINMDSVEYADPTYLHGLNLYAYCNNNPIMYVDPNGNLPQWVMWLIGGAIIAGLAIATVATGGAAGGVAGFVLAGALKGAAVGAVSGALLNGAINGINVSLDGGEFWSGFCDGAAYGFMSGAIIGGISGAITSGIQVNNASKLWANTGNKTAYRQMVEHYKKHVIQEGQQLIAKNIVNYSKQASDFYINNFLSGRLLRNGVVKISGAPGGIFNTNGLIRSFWYI